MLSNDLKQTVFRKCPLVEKNMQNFVVLSPQSKEWHIFVYCPCKFNTSFPPHPPDSVPSSALRSERLLAGPKYEAINNSVIVESEQDQTHAYKCYMKLCFVF